ncbi:MULTISPECIES: O-antigen ligase family protein [Ruegeria]|uniref:O-antigen ligase family protein n=1 Tax=Ruegeria TaxID=97050 RepID=UPI00147DF721|nr:MULTISPECIES: hypothetical protein [Ruegeria]
MSLEASTGTRRNLQAAGDSTGRTSRPFVIPLLFIGFTLPLYFEIAGLQLSGYRIVLLVFFFPALIRWLDGSGGYYAPDFLVLGYALWAALAIFYHHALWRWEYIGISFIETIGPYFIARWMIRDEHAFRVFVRWIFIAVLLMLPFSVYQFIADRSLILEIFGKIGNVYNVVQEEPRLGFYRAQGSMPHPILYGVFCSVAFSLVWYVLGYGKGFTFKMSRAGNVLLATFVSLSSGAWLSIVVQIALMAWKTIFAFLQRKWNLLLYMFAGLYLFLEIFANRPPAQIFAAYLTLKKSTAMNRIFIFTFASDDVLNNPIFGIGFNEWSRPRWIVGSVDNFWLVVALRYGLPSLIFIVAAIVMTFVILGRAQLSSKLESYRLGYLFALTGFCVSAITVHVWDATLCLLMFLLGAGIWMVNTKEESDQLQVEANQRRTRRIRYTRFGPEET